MVVSLGSYVPLFPVRILCKADAETLEEPVDEERVGDFLVGPAPVKTLKRPMDDAAEEVVDLDGMVSLSLVLSNKLFQTEL
jgi:hypothetical protein